jgi:hypothetical protein
MRTADESPSDAPDDLRKQHNGEDGDRALDGETSTN